jgi:hypothetical protein
VGFCPEHFAFGSTDAKLFPLNYEDPPGVSLAFVVRASNYLSLSAAGAKPEAKGNTHSPSTYNRF